MHELTVYYRPDNYPQWIEWRRFTQKFDLIGVAGALDAGGVPSAYPGFYPRLSFGKPKLTCDPTTSRETTLGFEFQVKLNGTGHVVLDRFRIHAQKLVEKSLATC